MFLFLLSMWTWYNMADIGCKSNRELSAFCGQNFPISPIGKKDLGIFFHLSDNYCLINHSTKVVIFLIFRRKIFWKTILQRWKGNGQYWRRYCARFVPHDATCHQTPSYCRVSCSLCTKMWVNISQIWSTTFAF